MDLDDVGDADRCQVGRPKAAVDVDDVATNDALTVPVHLNLRFDFDWFTMAAAGVKNCRPHSFMLSQQAERVGEHHVLD